MLTIVYDSNQGHKFRADKNQNSGMLMTRVEHIHSIDVSVMLK